MLRGQMSPWQLEYVLNVHRNLPLKQGGIIFFPSWQDYFQPPKLRPRKREFWQLTKRLVMRDFQHFSFKYYTSTFGEGVFFLWQEMPSCDRIFLPVRGNVFLWKEISSCLRKFVQWQQRSSCNRNFFMWQGISFFELKFCPVRGNFFLWQHISSCHRKFLPVIGNFFLRQ